MDRTIEDEREDVDEFGILLGDGIGRAMRISITQGIERQRNGPILIPESNSSKRLEWGTDKRVLTKKLWLESLHYINTCPLRHCPLSGM